MPVHMENEKGERVTLTPKDVAAIANGTSAAETSTQQPTPAAVKPSALVAEPRQTTQSAKPAAEAVTKPVEVAPRQIPATQALRNNMTNPMQSSNVLARIRQSTQAPLSATAQADAVVKMIEAIRTQVDDKNTEYNIAVLPINANDASIKLFASSVVVCVTRKGEENTAMAYHTLLLADTAPRNRVDQVQVENNQIIEVPRVTSDAYDADYKAVVLQELQKHFPNTKVMLDAEGEVIPTGYNYKDDALVRKTLANALLAAATILRTYILDAQFPDIVLTDLMEGGERLDTVARLTFGNGNIQNSVGAPVRADVRIHYSLTMGQQQGRRGQIQSLNTGQQQVELFSIAGFGDLLWRENEQLMGIGQNQYAAPFQPQVQMQGQNPWKYQPRFIVTDTSSPELATLPGILWGLGSVMILQKSNNWMGMFQRNAEAEHHDIGAIGIETRATAEGFGMPYEDTRSVQFSTKNLYDMLTAFLRPELVISIDVDESGPLTWQNSVFVAAATDPNANQEIITAANLLTNGNFKKYYPTNASVVVDDENRIHLGTFTDVKGNVRDIREIDYLAVLNMLGSSNPELGRLWSDTFARLDYTWDRRWHERLKVIKLITSNFNITGAARRVTFKNEFLNALAQAMQDCGLQIRPETPFMEMTSANRAQADWISGATVGYNANNNLFNRGMGVPGGAPINTFGSSFGRWRR